MNTVQLFIDDHLVISGAGHAAVGKVHAGTIEVQQEVDIYDDRLGLLLSTVVTSITLAKGERVNAASAGTEVSVILRGAQAHHLQPNHQIVAKGAQPKHRPPMLDPTDPKSRLWVGTPGKSLGIALQGGGMKGAFGVGAMTLVAELGLLERPRLDAMVGASTGSLTTIVAAQAKGDPTAKLTRDEYFRLRSSKDMFLIQDDVQTVMEDSPILEKLVNGAMEGTLGDIDFLDLAQQELLSPQLVVKTLVGLSTGNPILALAGAAWGLFEEGSETREALETFLAIEPSIAELSPVRKRLQAVVDMDTITKNGIRLRLAVVSFNTGVVAYITEKGTLLYPLKTGTSEGLDWSQFVEFDIIRIGSARAAGRQTAEFKTMMINGALASSAIPGMFEPFEIEFELDGTERTELFFDGGTRENMTLRILAVEEIAEVIAIYCSPLESGVKDHTEPANKPWTSLASRAKDLIFDEVARTDSAVGHALNRNDLGSVEATPAVVHIAPGVPTLGLTEIHPRMTRATVWYGYMRAYDELWITHHTPDLNTRDQIRRCTDEIFQGLKGTILFAEKIVETGLFQIEPGDDWVHYERLQEDFSSSKKIHAMAFQSFSLRNYRRWKRLLLNGLDRRLELLGRRSFPWNHEGTRFLVRAFYENWDLLTEFNDMVDWGNLALPIRSVLSRHNPDSLLRLRLPDTDQEHQHETRGHHTFRDVEDYIRLRDNTALF